MKGARGREAAMIISRVPSPFPFPPSPFLLLVFPLTFVMSGFLADLLVVLHLLFVAFVGLGGLLVLRWAWVAWLHLPAALWGMGIELTGRICPLTPLEQELRRRAGESAYQGDFVSHYLLPVLYPRGLTRGSQLVLAALVLGINLAIYSVVLRRRRATAPRTSPGGGSPPAR
jgi:Protein of Unknown function (DUF2784)